MTDLPKFPLTMYRDSAFKKLTLASTGREPETTFTKDYASVTVLNDAEQDELFLEGWSMSIAKASADDLRKIADRTGAALPEKTVKDTELRKAAMQNEFCRNMTGAPRPLNKL